MSTSIAAAGTVGGIPEVQLETWSHPGAQKIASAAYHSIRLALAQYTFPEGVKYDVYLQGSYKNKTNVRGDSDVDVVIQLDSVFHPDVSLLTAEERRRYHHRFGDGAYGFDDFRTDVEKALTTYYGHPAVTSRTKCIEVAPPDNGGRLRADVVPCIQHRAYFQFTDRGSADYLEGMTFKTKRIFGGEWIVNYPKLHYSEGVAKNGRDRTGGWYKPTIRVLKNARNRYNEKAFFEISAPSYFIACLLSNVPDELFGDTFRETYLGTLAWLAGALEDPARAVAMRCQNGVVPLFGDRSDQWSQDDARRFVRAMAGLWEDW